MQISQLVFDLSRKPDKNLLHFVKLSQGQYGSIVKKKIAA